MEEIVSAQLFDALRRPALITDKDGVVLNANAAFRAAYDPKFGDIVGLPFTNIIEPLGNWRKSGHDGHYLAFRISGSESLNPAGRLQVNRYSDSGEGGYFVFVDSGTPFDAEELQGALSYIVENFPHPILVWDKSAQLLKYNEAGKNFFKDVSDIFYIGQDRQYFLRTAFERGIFRETKAGWQHSLDDVLKLQNEMGTNRGPISNEAEGLDGRFYRVTAYFSPDGWGASFYEDITELKSAQSELSTRKREFELILQNVPDFVVVADSDFIINYVNTSFASATGISQEDYVGRSCLSSLDVLAEEDDLVGLLMGAQDDNPLLTYDEMMRDKDGTRRWIRWHCRVLFEGNMRSGVIKIGRDITVEYEQEQNLRQQSLELRKKNESLEKFAAVVSHDLKAPLRHIAIFADMLVEETDKENYEQLPQFAKHIQNSAVRMDRVIKRLLEYSKVAYKTVSRERVSLSDIVIQAVQNLESQVENARAEILASDLPDYFGDPDLLCQLFQNLIGNAVKYCRPGGRPRVRIYCTKEAGSIRIIVEDNGIGIDPKFEESIFTAFRRLHKDETVYDGFGIGLALCKQIVESHQGTIRLDTNYQAGARFVIDLPGRV